MGTVIPAISPTMVPIPTKNILPTFNDHDALMDIITPIRNIVLYYSYYRYGLHRLQVARPSPFSLARISSAGSTRILVSAPIPPKSDTSPSEALLLVCSYVKFVAGQ
jgi:hypothetical protein